MTKEEIYKKISDTYNSDKGKNFITHLIINFISPSVSKSEYVQETENKSIECCLTKLKLISKGEAHKTYPLKEDFDHTTLAITCKGSDKYLCKEALDQLKEFYSTELKNGNKHMNWVLKNNGDKKVDKPVDKPNEPIAIIPVSDTNVVNTKISHKQINTNQPKPIYKPTNGYINTTKKAKQEVMTFGDLSVLQELKLKLEAKEKNS